MTLYQLTETYGEGIIVFNIAQQRETVLALIEAYRAYRKAAIKAGMWATRHRPPTRTRTRTRVKYKRTGRVDD